MKFFWIGNLSILLQPGLGNSCFFFENIYKIGHAFGEISKCKCIAIGVLIECGLFYEKK